MANPFVHMELNTPDLKKAQAFYGGMFGWKFTDNDMGPMGIYSTFGVDSGPGGGMYSVPGDTPAWLPYVGVDDIDEATAKARELGATIVRDTTEIPHVGWMTLITDPCGAPVALFEPLPRQQ